MTDELARVDALTPALDIDTIREQIAPDATDAELAHFANVCRALDLSPWAGQIVLVGRADKRVGRVVHRPQITVAGRRARAERSGMLDGIDGPTWCGPRVDGQLVWEELWTEDDYPYAARCLVYRKDWSRPANGTAKWSEFAQWETRNGATVLARFWSRMPTHMLGKVAESIALRRAFPDDAAYKVASTYVGDDDQSTIVEAAETSHEPA
jgi:hypothetical protein